MAKPEIVILDETVQRAWSINPAAGWSAYWNDLKKNRAPPCWYLSHDLNHVNEVCDRIVILERGEVKYDLQKNEDTLKELESYFAG